MTDPRIPRRCDRCGRRNRPNAKDAAQWNAVFKQGVLVGGRCPRCQTPTESLEAAVNEATTQYLGFDSDGRFWARPKGGE